MRAAICFAGFEAAATPGAAASAHARSVADGARDLVVADVEHAEAAQQREQRQRAVAERGAGRAGEGVGEGGRARAGRALRELSARRDRGARRAHRARCLERREHLLGVAGEGAGDEQRVGVERGRGVVAHDLDRASSCGPSRAAAIMSAPMAEPPTPHDDDAARRRDGGRGGPRSARVPRLGGLGRGDRRRASRSRRGRSRRAARRRRARRGRRRRLPLRSCAAA